MAAYGANWEAWTARRIESGSSDPGLVSHTLGDGGHPAPAPPETDGRRWEGPRGPLPPGGHGRPTVSCSVLQRSGHSVGGPDPLKGDVMGVHDSFAQQGLVRPRRGRLLAGVCAGLGKRFGLNPWIARILFLVILMIIPGSQIIVYPILWILMPSGDV